MLMCMRPEDARGEKVVSSAQQHPYLPVQPGGLSPPPLRDCEVQMLVD